MQSPSAAELYGVACTDWDELKFGFLVARTCKTTIFMVAAKGQRSLIAVTIIELCAFSTTAFLCRNMAMNCEYGRNTDMIGCDVVSPTAVTRNGLKRFAAILANILRAVI